MATEEQTGAGAAVATCSPPVANAALDSMTGSISVGHLNPSAKPLSLPNEIADIVRDADVALDLGVINAEFNPFAKQPATVDGVALVGPYQKP
jgi:hypothetical protein